MELRPVVFVGLLARGTVEGATDGAAARVETESPRGVLAPASGIAVPPTGDDVRFSVTAALVADAATPRPTADAIVNLDRQGEQFSSVVPVQVHNDAGQVAIWGELVDPLVGAAIAGDAYTGAFRVDYDPTPALDCGPLSAAEAAFVSSSPQDLGAVGYLGLQRAHQGSDASQPFRATGVVIDALTNVDGTRQLARVPESGGLLTVQFDGGVLFGMDVRPGPGWFEVNRSLTIDATAWRQGFGVSLTRAYAAAPDAPATCFATFAGSMVP